MGRFVGTEPPVELVYYIQVFWIVIINLFNQDSAWRYFLPQSSKPSRVFEVMIDYWPPSTAKCFVLVVPNAELVSRKKHPLAAGCWLIGLGYCADYGYFDRYLAAQSSEGGSGED